MAGPPVAVSRWRAVGALGLAAATAGVGYSILDDILLFQKCSRAALDAASQREDLTALVGQPLALGPWYTTWYTTTLAVSHAGRSVSATFPVEGPRGSALLHARALRSKGGRSTVLYNTVGEGEWHLFALQANVTQHPPTAPAVNPDPAAASAAKAPSPSGSENRPPVDGTCGGAGQRAGAGAGAGADSEPGEGGAPGEGGSPPPVLRHTPEGGASGPSASQWKTVHLDLLSPRGMPPLATSTGAVNSVCLPCQEQASNASQ